MRPSAKTAIRYGMNLVAMVDRHAGRRAAIRTAARFVMTEAAKVPKLAVLLAAQRLRGGEEERITWYSTEIVRALMDLGVNVEPHSVDLDAFNDYVRQSSYPKNYAAGPMDDGGRREQKLLEYFVSLEFLEIRSSDVVIDVASEWSMFPGVVRESIGATVYRQDLCYPAGIHADRIGGTAARMPVPDGFADKLVLHSAFGHFEGVADTEFVGEAWRVLKPGGTLCILPLFMSDRYAILTDPLVNRRGVVWDEGARIVERLWWHNRFGRIYDAAALNRRVLTPGRQFLTTIYRITNAPLAHSAAKLDFALVMRKPNAKSGAASSRGGDPMPG